MDNIVAWNIRGLNWPNKQADLRTFLHTNKIGMIGLMQTKIKVENDSKIAARAFPRWKWENNSTLQIKGRIWIAWHPKMYELQVLHKTDQIMHCYAIQMTTHKKFYITFVYGINHDHHRQSMWANLLAIY